MICDHKIVHYLSSGLVGDIRDMRDNDTDMSLSVVLYAGAVVEAVGKSSGITTVEVPGPGLTSLSQRKSA
jgi:hypothetical protein